MLLPVTIPSLLQLFIAINRLETTRLLETPYIQLIHLKTADLQWIKTDNEILINGESFDIKKITINGNELLVTGIFDQIETYLLKKAGDLDRQKKDTQDLVVLKYLQLICTNYLAPVKYELKIPVLNSGYYSKNTSSYPDDILLKVPSPPPKA